MSDKGGERWRRLGLTAVLAAAAIAIVPATASAAQAYYENVGGQERVIFQAVAGEENFVTVATIACNVDGNPATCVYIRDGYHNVTPGDNCFQAPNDFDPSTSDPNAVGCRPAPVVVGNLLDRDDSWDARGSTLRQSVDGGEGADWLIGGSGPDVLTGGVGADDLQGAAGNDELDGGGDTDLLYGGAGNDKLLGGDGGDFLRGDEGDDELRGQGANDDLAGLAGDDVVDGGAGDDFLEPDRGIGGTGGISSGRDDLIGGPGYDEVSYLDKTVGVTITLDEQANDAGEGDNVHGDIERLVGSRGNDIITGNEDVNQIDGDAGNDEIRGAGGNDLLLGSTGNDMLFGEAGNDRVEGSSNDDIVDGGAGRDVLEGDTACTGMSCPTGGDEIRARDGEEDRVTCGPGPDKAVVDELDIVTSDPQQACEVFDRSAGTDCTIQGTSGNDTLIGTPGNDVICAGAGKDIVRGGGGNDVIRLEGGNDKGYGGSGKDRIVGGKGKDRLFGGAGNDTLLARDRVRGELVDGGPGRRDRCTADRRDIRRRCP